MTKTFKHSGDLGDIIYSLPAVRALGGGVMYLDPEGGFSSPLVKWADRTRTKLNAGGIEALRPLLMAQPYVAEVRVWQGETVDVDLDIFRRHLVKNLSDAHLVSLGLPTSERDTAWLTVPEPVAVQDRPIVISRTPRYVSNHNFWEEILPQIMSRCVFVGLPKDYEIFVHTFGHEPPYVQTADLMQLAQLIAGCRRFVGNENLARAIAEGLKKDLVNELNRASPHTVFNRPGAEYV